MQAAGAQGPMPELPGEAAEVSRDYVVQDLLELGGVFGFYPHETGNKQRVSTRRVLWADLSRQASFWLLRGGWTVEGSSGRREISWTPLGWSGHKETVTRVGRRGEKRSDLECILEAECTEFSTGLDLRRWPFQ